MDWGKCALCQEDDIGLLDPLQNKDLEVDGYSKLAENIDSFLNKDLPLPAKCTTSVINLQGDRVILLIISVVINDVLCKFHLPN